MLELISAVWAQVYSVSFVLEPWPQESVPGEALLVMVGITEQMET